MLNFRRVKKSLPHGPKAPLNYGPFKYLGSTARERIRDFEAARDAERLINKSYASDE